MVPFLDMEVEAFDPNIIAWMAKDEHGKSVLYTQQSFLVEQGKGRMVNWIQNEEAAKTVHRYRMLGRVSRPLNLYTI